MGQRTQPGVRQVGVVVEVAVAVQVPEAGEAARVLAIDDLAVLVHRQAVGVDHQVERRGIGEVERRAAVTQGGHGLELDGIGVWRAGRQHLRAAGILGSFCRSS